jgi:tRNA(adenine34) deaminase
MEQKITDEFLFRLMSVALDEARKAASAQEVPIGAAIAHDGKIVGRGHNRTEEQKSALAHAELEALRQANTVLKNWRLDDCVLAVTVEPCTMCAGAILLSRIPVVVFGTREPLSGALGSRFDVSVNDQGMQSLRVIEGILEEEAKTLLKQFFLSRR